MLSGDAELAGAPAEVLSSAPGGDEFERRDARKRAESWLSAEEAKLKPFEATWYRTAMLLGPAQFAFRPQGLDSPQSLPSLRNAKRNPGYPPSRRPGTTVRA